MLVITTPTVAVITMKREKNAQSLTFSVGLYEVRDVPLSRPVQILNNPCPKAVNGVIGIYYYYIACERAPKHSIYINIYSWGAFSKYISMYWKREGKAAFEGFYLNWSKLNE